MALTLTLPMAATARSSTEQFSSSTIAGRGCLDRLTSGVLPTSPWPLGAVPHRYVGPPSHIATAWLDTSSVIPLTARSTQYSNPKSSIQKQVSENLVNLTPPLARSSHHSLPIHDPK